MTLHRTDLPLIGNAARRMVGHRMVVCYLADHYLPGGGTTFDYSLETVDLADNSSPLKSTAHGVSDGMLDVWVYSYMSPRDLADGFIELEGQLSVTLEAGRVVKVE